METTKTTSNQEIAKLLKAILPHEQTEPEQAETEKAGTQTPVDPFISEILKNILPNA